MMKQGVVYVYSCRGAAKSETNGSFVCGLGLPVFSNTLRGDT